MLSTSISHPVKRAVASLDEAAEHFCSDCLALAHQRPAYVRCTLSSINPDELLGRIEAGDCLLCGESLTEGRGDGALPCCSPISRADAQERYVQRTFQLQLSGW